MRLLKLLLCIPLVACAATLGAGQDPPPPNLGWLSGHWCSQVEGQLIEEYWLPARGDISLGVGRTLKGGTVITYEFMRIETRNGVTNYTSLHDGQPGVAFRLVASGADWARFENLEHDFPKRIEYRRTPGGLHAEIAGPGHSGKELVIPFDYRLCVD